MDVVAVFFGLVGAAIALVSFMSAVQNRPVQINRLASGESDYERHHSRPYRPRADGDGSR